LAHAAARHPRVLARSIQRRRARRAAVRGSGGHLPRHSSIDQPKWSKFCVARLCAFFAHAMRKIRARLGKLAARENVDGRRRK
jgi:hypothetical protein